MKCDICKTDHEPYQAHVFPKTLGEAVEGLRNQGSLKRLVTVTTICNQCVTKDAEIERLRNQLVKHPAKRDRSAYMRKYRAK